MQATELKTRRTRVVVAFATLFLVGLGLYSFAPEKSTLQSMGAAFMIAWLPGVAWFTVWFAKKRAPVKRVPVGFTPEQAHQEHVRIEACFAMEPLPREDVAVVQELSCLLLLGTEGFTVRLWSASPDEADWAQDRPVLLSAQFLSPAVAMPRFTVGTAARLLVGRTVVGEATVVAAAG